VLPIFAVMSVVLLGGAALLTDVAWWWTNELRMKAAADAAALAGAVYLPNDQARAYAAAFAEATKNGYTSGVGGITVTPERDLPDNPRKLIVNIDGPVQTNFARVFCWDGGPCLDEVDVGVTGAAEFVLPVPMGSPENYYGVFGMTRGLTETETQTVTVPHSDPHWTCGSSDGWNAGSGCQAARPNASENGANWTATSGPLATAPRNDDNAYAQTTVTGAQQQWSTFGAQAAITNPGAGETVDIVGLQVRLTDAHRTTNCSSGSANIGVQLSWDAGNNWTTQLTSGALGTDTGSGDYVLGSAASTAPWGGHAWTRADFADGPSRNFRVRLTANETCSQASVTFRVDRVDVRVKWVHNYTTTTTTTVTTPVADQLLRGPGTACTTGKASCFEADGAALNPRGFWATLNTQGAENVNGDAHQTGYDERTSAVALNCPADEMACYDGEAYYNYAVEMPPGSTGGAVYIYDPQFCAVQSNPPLGTSDRWFGGSAPVSTFYEVFDTGISPADPGDDVSLASTDGLFRGLDADDSTMGGGTGGALECMYRTDTQYGDGRDYHNRWFLLYSGMTGGANGKVYRIHTTSTDPAAPTQQLGTNGENSFAIFASASGGAPKVYGMGAMQAYTPLRASGSEVVSEFYLAQIEEAHKGKTVEIRLWDPGDTGNLSARLQVLIPTSTGWTPTSFSYEAIQGTTHSAVADDCDDQTSSGANEVQTNAGGGAPGIFNGCWLTLRAQVPDTYTAEQDGWWRIRYRMNGNASSFDVTTWTVNLVGNPVHLVMP
jgi:Flp pilus assembly protein TadG